MSRNQEANLYFEIAQFIINRHLPFDSAPSILEFCREIALNYEVQLLERSHLSAPTITKIIRECIGDTLRSRIIQDLGQGPFALLIDASSDIYGGKYLGVLARYICDEEDLIVTKLLAVLELTTSSTGEEFYQVIENQIFVLNPTIKKNFVAICTDNGSSMISSQGSQVDPKGKGFVNRFSKEIQGLIFIRDVCHLYNLVLDDALSTYPAYILQFIKRICAYFNTGHRSCKLKEIQVKNGIKEPLEVLHCVDTRWESLLNCVEHLLKLCDHLKESLQSTVLDLKKR